MEPQSPASQPEALSSMDTGPFSPDRTVTKIEGNVSMEKYLTNA